MSVLDDSRNSHRQQHKACTRPQQEHAECCYDGYGFYPFTHFHVTFTQRHTDLWPLNLQVPLES